MPNKPEICAEPIKKWEHSMTAAERWEHHSALSAGISKEKWEALHLSEFEPEHFMQGMFNCRGEYVIRKGR